MLFIWWSWLFLCEKPYFGTRRTVKIAIRLWNNFWSFCSVVKHYFATFLPCLPEPHYTILWPCIYPPSLILLAVVTSHVFLPRGAFQLLGNGFLSYSESWPTRMGPIRCPETSVTNYHTTPCNYPEDHRFHQHRGWSLKLRLLRYFPNMCMSLHNLFLYLCCSAFLFFCSFNSWLCQYWLFAVNLFLHCSFSCLQCALCLLKENTNQPTENLYSFVSVT
jgi:hypothetical protein